MKRQISFFIFMIGLLVLIPISSLLVTQKSDDIRSKAAEEKILPVLPPLSPFIRLGTKKDHAKKGDLLPIYITSKANDQNITEAQIVVSYDPLQLVLEEKNLRNDNVFPVINISSLEPGKAIFSLFVDTQSGYDPVSLPEEKTIATLFFTVVGEKEDAAIRLIHDGEEKTQLFTNLDVNTGEAPDVLSSTQDVIIHLD